jgi:hypothetical protein
VPQQYDVFLPDDSDLGAKIEDLKVGSGEPLPGLERIRIDETDLNELKRRFGAGMNLTSSDDLAQIVRTAFLPKIPGNVTVVPATSFVPYWDEQEKDEQRQDDVTDESAKEQQALTVGTVEPPKDDTAVPGVADQKAARQPQVARPAADIGLAALSASDALWDYLDEPGRKQLARDVLREVYAARRVYARQFAWGFASEFELLQTVDENDRGKLAESIIKMRAGLTDSQIQRAQQDVEAQKKVVSLLDEFHQQARKWTRLAEIGVWLLVGTNVFAAAMTGWLISVAADKDISGWSLPAAIFALALFAVSPAVLLLRERPLKGIDEWMPSASDSKTERATKGSADTGSTDSIKPDKEPARD